MTDKPMPTDAELEALLLDKLPASKHYIRPVIEKMVAAMQAAIDKWGQPAPAPVSDDTKRLDWMDKDAGERVFHVGADWYTRPTYGQPYRKHKNLRAAIDAALAAQGGSDAK